MFGSSYFGVSYFGANYFGGGSGAPADPFLIYVDPEQATLYSSVGTWQVDPEMATQVDVAASAFDCDPEMATLHQ